MNTSNMKPVMAKFSRPPILTNSCKVELEEVCGRKREQHQTGSQLQIANPHRANEWHTHILMARQLAASNETDLQ